MFKRKTPLNFWQTLRQAVWPKMGWYRVLKYYYQRIVRLSSTTRSIAINIAAGAAISFTPFFGIHILGSMAIAWMLGAGFNPIAAIVGTLLGNPWTTPFMMFISYSLGKYILDLTGVMTAPVNMSPDFIDDQSENMIQHFLANTWDMFLPTAVGGTLMMLITGPILYYISYKIVRGAQRARTLRMRRKQRAMGIRGLKGIKLHRKGLPK